MSDSRAGRGLRDRREAEFVAGDRVTIFSLGSFPVREGAALDVDGKGLIGVVYRIGTELGETSVYDGFVFLGSSRRAIVRSELGEIRTEDRFHIVPVSVVRYLAARVGTVKIGRRLTVGLQRDRDESPRADEFVRGLRGRCPG